MKPMGSHPLDLRGTFKGIRRRVTVKGKIRMPPLKTAPCED